MQVAKTLGLPLLSGVLLACIGLGVASAEQYPDRQIHVIVASAPGTSPDQIARLLKPGLEARLKQTIVIENKVGANGLIAVNAVSQSKPDGYTILVATAATFTANPTLYAKSGGDKIVDFEPVALVASTTLTLAVRSDLGVKTCPELIDLVRHKPGALNLASSTQGSFTHLAAEMVKYKAKLDFQVIPFMGAVAGATAVAGGHSDFMIEATSTLQPFIDSGRLLPLATTGTTRDPFLPDIMTLQECGVPDFALNGWVGVTAPKGTDADAVQSLHRAIESISKDPEYVARLATLKWNSTVMAPAEFGRLITRERDDMRQTIQSADIVIH